MGRILIRDLVKKYQSTRPQVKTLNPHWFPSRDCPHCATGVQILHAGCQYWVWECKNKECHKMDRQPSEKA